MEAIPLRLAMLTAASAGVHPPALPVHCWSGMISTSSPPPRRWCSGSCFSRQRSRHKCSGGIRRIRRRIREPTAGWRAVWPYRRHDGAKDQSDADAVHHRRGRLHRRACCRPSNNEVLGTAGDLAGWAFGGGWQVRSSFAAATGRVPGLEVAGPLAGQRAAMLCVGLLVRMRIAKMPDFRRAKKPAPEDSPGQELLRMHRRDVALATGARLVETVSGNMIKSFGLTYVTLVTRSTHGRRDVDRIHDDLQSWADSAPERAAIAVCAHVRCRRALHWHASPRKAQAVRCREPGNR